MPATDDMISQLAGEIDQQQQFQDKLLEDAKKDGRDLTADDMALIERSRNTMQEKAKQLDPLKQAAEIATSSRQMVSELNLRVGDTRPAEVEYRSAGEYIRDFWQASLGVEEATRRIKTFDRAAAHQTTADNPGLLPQQILGPVINFVDQARPLVSALGPRNLPSGAWSRPKISQHTNIAPQSGEKTELVSRKMIIGMIPVTAVTYGGYVNLSRQNLDWSQPGIFDIVVEDLAGVYAQETEKALAVAIDAATTAGPVIPTGTPTPAVVNAAIWTAVGSIYTAVKGAGRVIVAVSPDMLGLVGPLFAPVNPTNAYSPGFSAGDFASGANGTISGLSVVMSPGLDAGSIIVLSTAAVEVYENRIGALQVVEPSVLGLQVSYAGYFAPLIIDPTGVIEITKTP